MNPTVEEFLNIYGTIQFGKSFDDYNELKKKLTLEEIENYRKDKLEYDSLSKKTNIFTEKVKKNNANEDDYNQQRERDKKVKSLNLNPEINKFLSLEKDILPEFKLASEIREVYIKDYIPKDRSIKWIEGNYNSPAPPIFRNLQNILKADGASIYERENNSFDDIIYCGGEICGRTDGQDTYPVLRHAKETDNFGLFFIAYRPLIEHCRGDQELRTAIELKQQNKKIIIITNGYEYFSSAMRFL